MSQQKGITLLEILITTAILGIVGVLAFSVYQQTIKSNNNINSRISLSSEANIVMTTIEKEYYANPLLCFTWNEQANQLSIGNTEKYRLLHREGLEIESFSVSPSLNENGCVETTQTVTIQIEVNEKGRTGKPFHLKTTFYKR